MVVKLFLIKNKKEEVKRIRMVSTGFLKCQRSLSKNKFKTFMVLSSKKIATELKANNKSTYTNRFLASVLSKFFLAKITSFAS